MSGLAGAIVRNYSAMAKVALPAGFSVGLFYSLAHGTDAKQAVLGAFLPSLILRLVLLFTAFRRLTILRLALCASAPFSRYWCPVSTVAEALG